jgi:hypothetical protein
MTNTTSKSAYKVTAKVEGKTWLYRATVLTAQDEAEAMVKAKNLLKLTDEHTVVISPVTVYNTAAKLETDAYPYGGLKCTAFFSVEYNGNKGARTRTQTINPKTGRVNNPKHSTYYRVILPIQEQNGHFDFCGYLDFNGTDAINTGLQFMADFYDLFTIEQIKSIAIDIMAMSKINTKAIIIYAGSTWEDLKPLITESLQTLVKIANEGSNLFAACFLDEAAIEATKKPNYNPFTVTEYTVSA